MTYKEAFAEGTCSVKQAASILHTKTQTIYAWIKRGNIPDSGNNPKNYEIPLAYVNYIANNGLDLRGLNNSAYTIIEDLKEIEEEKNKADRERKIAEEEKLIESSSLVMDKNIAKEFAKLLSNGSISQYYEQYRIAYRNLKNQQNSKKKNYIPDFASDCVHLHACRLQRAHCKHQFGKTLTMCCTEDCPAYISSKQNENEMVSFYYIGGEYEDGKYTYCSSCGFQKDADYDVCFCPGCGKKVDNG